MIEILVEGYLRKENGVLREAHSTVTAIIQDDLVIIVDTSSKEYRHRLLESLEQKGIDRHRVDIPASQNTGSPLGELSSGPLPGD